MYSLEETEAIVSRNFFLYWDGWTVMAVDPTKDGFYRTNGVFYNGRWSLLRAIEPNEEGQYAIPGKYTQHIKATRGRS